MHAPPASGQEWPQKSTPQPNPWLVHLSRGMWLRGHISVFAIGSVILLAVNLLRGSGGVWADTAIGAWAVLVIAHGILLIIARLLQELLSDEDDAGIRPASEVHWNTPSTWTLPQRIRERSNGTVSETPTPVTTPTLDPEASAAAAAARDRRRKQAPPKPAPEPVPEPEAESAERVPWQAATDAAWLATNPRDTPVEPAKQEKPAPDPDDDDFTPLKFD